MLQSGKLTMELGEAAHDLAPGDCLRYRLDGGNTFRAGPDGAGYLLFVL